MTAAAARTPTEEAAAKARLRLWLRLLKVVRGVEADLRERLRTEFATTLPRFDVMAALSRYPEGLKMTDISGLLKVSNGNVTGIVERLVADGIATRGAVPGDRRATVVKLTAEGREEFDRQAAAHERWISDRLSALDPPSAVRLAEALDGIRERETPDA